MTKHGDISSRGSEKGGPTYVSETGSKTAVVMVLWPKITRDTSLSEMTLMMFHSSELILMHIFCAKFISEIVGGGHQEL